MQGEFLGDLKLFAKRIWKDFSRSQWQNISFGSQQTLREQTGPCELQKNCAWALEREDGAAA